MAIGDAALAAGMDILNGNEPANTLDTEENKTRDYIAQRTSAVTAVAKGGTGATTAAAARTNLGINIAPGNIAEANKIPSYNGSSQLTTAAPSLNDHCARKADVDAVAAAIPARQWLDDGTSYSVIGRNVSTSGSFFTGGATAVTNGFVAAYINSDGRIGRSPSSERYKRDITPLDPAELGDVFPELHSYVLRGDPDAVTRYGWISEQLHESDAQRPFVVYDEQERPDSIDFVALLMVQNAQLHQAVDLLSQRIAALEANS